MAGYHKSDELTDILSKIDDIFNKYKTSRVVQKDLKEVRRLGIIEGRYLQSYDYMQALSEEYAKVKKLKI